MRHQLVHNLAIIINLVTFCSFVIVYIKKGKGVSNSILALGLFVTINLLFETTLKYLPKYGLDIIDYFGSVLNVSRDQIIKTCRFYIVNNKYVANIFIVNFYSIVDISFNFVILLLIYGASKQIIQSTVFIITTILTVPNYFYFDPYNIIVSPFLIVIDSIPTLILCTFVLYAITIKINRVPKPYEFFLIYGIIFNAIANLGYLLYQQATPHFPLYFTAFFSNLGNVIYSYIFARYLRDE